MMEMHFQRWKLSEILKDKFRVTNRLSEFFMGAVVEDSKRLYDKKDSHNLCIKQIPIHNAVVRKDSFFHRIIEHLIEKSYCI